MTIFTDKVNPVLKENVVCVGRASSMIDAYLDTAETSVDAHAFP